MRRQQQHRPLTYAEKVLYNHLDTTFDKPIFRGKSQLKPRPLRIACQDATAQMALIQFMSAGLESAAVPTTVHCDHLIVSRDGEAEDLPTKGAFLIVTSSEIEYHAKNKFGASPTVCGILGGIGGGVAQSSLTMGMTTCMKTVEVTRSRQVVIEGKLPGFMGTFTQIVREKGIRGVNKGVNAVALRQVTGWSSRIGISRAAEESICPMTGKSSGGNLKFGEKILASVIGGALSCWNQPFEVLRVEMQSMKKDPTRPVSPTVVDFQVYHGYLGIQRAFQKCGTSHRCCGLGNNLHGWVWGYCQRLL